MSPALHPRFLEFIEKQAHRFLSSLLDTIAKSSWSALKRLLGQSASTESNRRHDFCAPQAETIESDILREEVWETIREEVREIARDEL